MLHICYGEIENSTFVDIDQFENNYSLISALKSVHHKTSQNGGNDLRFN